jgi:hypothetical protein
LGLHAEDILQLAQIIQITLKVFRGGTYHLAVMAARDDMCGWLGKAMWPIF